MQYGCPVITSNASSLPEAGGDAALYVNPLDVEDIKKNIREGIATEKEAKESERIHAKMLEELVKQSESDPPTIMIEKSVDNLVQEVKQLNPDAKEDETARETLRGKAKERLMAHLVLHALAERESLNPSEEEVSEELRRRSLDRDTYYDYIYGILRHRNIFAFLERSSQ